MCHYWSHHRSLEEGEFQGAGTGAALVAVFFTLLLFFPSSLGEVYHPATVSVAVTAAASISYHASRGS